MAEEPKSFGEYLRSVREEKGLTLGQVAEKSKDYIDGGLHTTAILRIEHNERDPKLSTLSAIAGALGVEMRITGEGIVIK